MNMNLYPYNYYALLIAIILVIIFLFLSLKHLASLAKTVQNMHPALENIQKQSTLMQIKQEVLQEKKQESHKNDKYFKVLLPLLAAIYTTYRDDDECNGIKGYKKACKTVFQKKNTNLSKIFSQIR